MGGCLPTRRIGKDISKTEERLKFIRYWKEETGNTEVDMIEVAKLALKMGWEAPPPLSREEALAKREKLAKALEQLEVA